MRHLAAVFLIKINCLRSSLKLQQSRLPCISEAGEQCKILADEQNSFHTTAKIHFIHTSIYLRDKKQNK